VVHILLAYGSDPNALTIHYQNGFDLLCANAGNLACIKLLRDMGGKLKYPLLLHLIGLALDIDNKVRMQKLQ